MNTRRLAGSRRNKHLPIARRTLVADGQAGRSARASAGKASIQLPRGDQWVYPRDLSYRSKPDHAARAVDIRAIWPPLNLDDSTAKRRLAAEAGARGVSADPMTSIHRVRSYRSQNQIAGRVGLTARQRRQVNRMHYRAGLAQAGA